MAHLSCLFRQGLYQALKGSTPSLRAHYTLEHCLFQKADLDLTWYHPFWPGVGLYHHKGRQRDLAFLHWLKVRNLLWCLIGILWFCQVVLELKKNAISVALDQLPEQWITVESYQQGAICQILLSVGRHKWEWASKCMIEGVYASDSSAGAMWQVRRCNARPDEGWLIQQHLRFRGRKRARAIETNVKVTEGAEQTSKVKYTKPMLCYCFF